MPKSLIYVLAGEAGEGPGETAADVAKRDIAHAPHALSRPSATLSHFVGEGTMQTEVFTR